MAEFYISETLEINKPASDVFNFLSDQTNHRKFVKANTKSYQLSEGPMKAGAEVVNHAKFLGIDFKEHFEVVEFVPGKVIKKHSKKGSTVETWDKFELSPVKNGTALRMTVWGKPSGIVKLVYPVMSPLLKRALKKDLRRLKHLLENN